MKMQLSFATVAICLAATILLSGCGAEKRPDTIYLGGTIYTGNSEAPIVEAVGTIKSRIVYVGDVSGVIKDTHPKTKLIDLKGNVMYPGFINTHVGPLAQETDENAGIAIEESAIEFAKLGWTTIHVYDTKPTHVRNMEDLAMASKIPVRIYNILNEAGFESLAQYGPGVSPGGLIETRAILLNTEKDMTPFVADGETPSVETVLRTALKRHVQLIVIEPEEKFSELLDLVELVLKDAEPDADPRWRLVLREDPDPVLIDRAIQLGFMIEWGDADGPDSTSVPDFFRYVFDEPNGMLNRLHEMTYGSAKIGFRESVIGSIEVGKLADFTIMSGDLLTLEEDKLAEVVPVMTIIGGAQAWPRPEKTIPIFGE